MHPLKRTTSKSNDSAQQYDAKVRRMENMPTLAECRRQSYLDFKRSLKEKRNSNVTVDSINSIADNDVTNDNNVATSSQLKIVYSESNVGSCRSVNTHSCSSSSCVRAHAEDTFRLFSNEQLVCGSEQNYLPEVDQLMEDFFANEMKEETGEYREVGATCSREDIVVLQRNSSEESTELEDELRDYTEQVESDEEVEGAGLNGEDDEDMDDFTYMLGDDCDTEISAKENDETK